MSFLKPNRFFHLFTLVLLSSTLTACGGGSGGSGSPATGGTPPAHNLQQIVISPYIDSVAKGAQVNLTATGIYDDQSSEDLTTQVAWSVDDNTLASIDTSGTFLPLEAGLVTVTASLDGLQAQRSLSINDVTLNSIQVIPQQADLASGLQQSFQAIGNYSDGSTQDLSQQVEWESSNTQVAQVTAAVVVSKAIGTATISATLNGVSGQASLSVNNASLQRIEITVNNPNIPVGLSSSITVLGFYSDHTISDVTALASLQIDDASVISFDATTATVQAIAVGQTTISAEVSGFQDDMALQVNDAVLSKIEITPENSSVPAGFKQQFTATGIYNNQSSWDLTELATWVSSDDLIAEVDNRLQTKGEVTAVKKGSAILTAHFDGKSVSADLMVSDASLVGIDVTPISSTVAVGLLQQFEAIAQFSDGSQKVVTDQVEWSSSSQIVSLLGNDNPGLLRTNSSGNVLLIATLNKMKGFTSLKVSDATLNNLTVTVTDKQAMGTTQKLTAEAEYSDGTTVDVSEQVSWNSMDATIAHVSNTAGSRGQVSTLSTGTVSISANMGSISSSQTLEVTAATLQKIQLSSSVNSLYVNQQGSLRAVGFYSDASQQDLTQQVQWMSSADQIIAVSNASESPGLMTALSEGSANVSASFAGVTSSALPFQVIDKPNFPASVSVWASPNVILNDGVDSTTLKATVKPLQSKGAIEDGTAVNFIILDNGVTRNIAASTSGGVASINLTSTDLGLILVKAEVVDTNITATTTINSTDSFAYILQVGRSEQVTVSSDNSTYLAGSKFFMYLRNLSNRDFNIVEFFAKNGGVDFSDSPVKNPGYLSGGVLEGGEYTGIGYQLDEDTVDNTISIGYILYDSVSEKAFVSQVSYTVSK